MKLVKKGYPAALLVLALLIPLIFDGYVLTVLAFALTYGIIATGYNTLLGYTGLFSFGHMAFAGLGAYTCLLLMNHLHLPFLLAMLAAVLFSALIAGITALPAIGLKGHFFGISTLAVGETIVLLLTNLQGLTGGAQGILLKETPSIFGIKLAGDLAYYYMALAFFVIALGFIWFMLNRTTTGKTWIASRGDENFTSALGIDVRRAKLSGYIAGSALAAFGGCAYLVIMSCLAPDQFKSSCTTQVIMMVLIGGKGTLFGPLLGAMLLTWLPHILNMTPQMKMIVYGLVLVVVILGVPQGIIGTIKRYWRKRKNARG